MRAQSNFSEALLTLIKIEGNGQPLPRIVNVRSVELPIESFLLLLATGGRGDADIDATALGLTHLLSHRELAVLLIAKLQGRGEWKPPQPTRTRRAGTVPAAVETEGE